MKVELLLFQRNTFGLFNLDKEILMEKDKHKPDTSKEAPRPNQEPPPRKTGREFMDDKINRTQAQPGKSIRPIPKRKRSAKSSLVNRYRLVKSRIVHLTTKLNPTPKVA
jgi:hypothetical protein